MITEEETLTYDAETGAYFDAETGEIISTLDAPDTDLSQPSAYKSLADWLGPRLVGAEARRVALEAEKAAWLEKVSDQFDARIKRQERLIAYLKRFFGPYLEPYARQLLANEKAKSVRLGLLLLKFTATRAKTNVIDQEKAINYLLESGHGEAVKTSYSVLTSKVPSEVKALPADQTGLDYYPGGEDVFSIE